MATELATAYLEITPTLRGAQEAIASQLKDVDVTEAGETLGASLLAGVKKALAAVEKVGGKTVGKIGGAFSDLVVKGGVKRALALDQERNASSGSGETFEGAKENVTGALANMGASFASPALDGLKQVLIALVPAIEAVSRVLQPLVGAFSGFVSLVSSKAVAGIGAFTETMNRGGGVLEAFKAAFQTAFDGAGAALSGIGGLPGVIGEKIGSLSEPVGRAMGLFTDFARHVADRLSGVGVSAASFSSLFSGALLLFGGPLASAVTAISGIGAKVAGGLQSLTGLAAGFSGAGGGARMLTTLLGALGGPVGIAVAAIAALAAGFAYLMVTNEGFRNTVAVLVEQIGASLAPILVIVGEALASLADTVLPIVASLIALIVPVIGQIAVALLQIFAALAPVVTTIAAVLVPIVTQIIQLVASLVAQAMTLVVPLISMIVACIQEAMPTIQALTTIAMMAVLAIVQTVWPIVQSVIETVMHVIQDVINVVTAAISGDWEGVWNGVKQLFSDIWEGIKSTAQAGVDAAYNIVTGIKDRVLGFFDGCGQWLCDAGTSIVEGLAGGIKGAVDAAVGAMTWVLDSVRSFLPFSPAKKGPFSGRGWTLYSGRSMVEAMADGATSSSGTATSAFSGVMKSVARTLSASEGSLALACKPSMLPGARRPALSYLAASSAGGSANTYNTIENVTLDASGLDEVEALFELFGAACREGRSR